MTVLIILFGMEESKTVFRLADEMAQDGNQIIFLFTGESSSRTFEQTVTEARRFAKSIYVLKESIGSLYPHAPLPEGIGVIDYGGWVELLEDCDRVVSWT